MIATVDVQDFRGIQKTSFELNQFTILSGLNRQGKTSALRAIEWGLGGKVNGSLVNLLTKNATARVKIKTDHGLLIERSYETGAKKSRIALYRPNGEVIPDGENLLEKNYAQLGFDPIRLIFMPPKEQAALIRDALSENITITDDEAEMLGFKRDPTVNAKTQLETQYQFAYNDRTGLNRVVKNLEVKAKTNGTSYVPDQSEIDAAEAAIIKIEKEYDEALKRTAQIEATKKNEATRARLKTVLDDLDAELKELDSFNGMSLAQITAKLDEQELAFAKSSIEETELRNDVRQLEKTIHDLGDSEFPICPISMKIVCNTNVSGVKQSIIDELANKTVALKTLFENNKEEFEKIKIFKNSVETFKRLDVKKGERERVQATLNSLGSILIEDSSDPNDLKTMLSEMRQKLAQMKISKEIANSDNLDGNILLATRADERVKAIRKFIDEELPKRLNLGLADIEVTNDGIFFHGFPMTDECTSVQLRIASMIIRRIYPNSKLITIDRLEVLDADTLKQFIERTAKDTEFQIVATYVGHVPDHIAKIAGVKVITMNKGVVV